MNININNMTMTMADNAFLAEVETTTIPDGNYQLLVNKKTSLSLFPGTSDIITMFKSPALTWVIRKASENPKYYNISTPSILGFMGNPKGELKEPITLVASPSSVWDFDIKSTMDDGSYVVNFKYIRGSSLYLSPGANNFVEGVQCYLGEKNTALDIRLKPVS